MNKIKRRRYYISYYKIQERERIPVMGTYIRRVYVPCRERIKKRDRAKKKPEQTFSSIFKCTI